MKLEPLKPSPDASQEVPLTGAPYLWQIVDAGDGNITATYNGQSFTGSPTEFTRRLT